MIVQCRNCLGLFHVEQMETDELCIKCEAVQWLKDNERRPNGEALKVRKEHGDKLRTGAQAQPGLPFEAPGGFN